MDRASYVKCMTKIDSLRPWPCECEARTHNLVLYLAHEHTRGLEGQPPVQYEHEVVTGDGDVDTLLQATP